MTQSHTEASATVEKPVRRGLLWETSVTLTDVRRWHTGGSGKFLARGLLGPTSTGQGEAMRRERYLQEGAGVLGDVELVALLLETGSGGRSALEIAAELCEQGGGLSGLARMQPQEWVGIVGVGMARAVRVHAALELGRRAMAEPVSGETVPDAGAAYALLRPRLRGLVDEELWGLFLDRRHRPLACRRLTHGSDALTVVDPRQVFRIAVAVGAVAVILAHNHPSGDPTPSEQDREVTLRVAHAGRMLGITLLDHLVCGSQGYVSIGPMVGGAPEGRWYVDG